MFQRLSHTLRTALLTVFFCALFLAGIYGAPIGEQKIGGTIGAIFTETVFAAQTAYCADGSDPLSPPRGGPLRCGNAVTGTPALYKDVPDEVSWMSLEWWTSGAFLIYITGILLGYAGWILNSSIYYFILTAADLLRGTGGASIGTSIVEGWTIIRDIVNLTFVFGLIYVAFMTVVKADTHDLKHAVPKILIFAILINFSLYFTKIIVDVSNVTSIEIHNMMSTKMPVFTDGFAGGQTIDDGISGFFMEKLGLLSLFDSNAVTSPGGSDGTGTNPRPGTDFGIGFALMVSILMLIAAFVFLAGALLIAIRFIVIVLLLILSPVAFASGFIPGLKTEEWTHKWWSTMVSQAIFAPAYLLLLYLSMKMVNVSVMAGTAGTGTSEGLTGFLKGSAGASIGSMLNFMLVIGFLVASLIVAKQAGAYGASSTLKWGKSARMMGQRALGNATFGLAAKVGRGTVGRVGDYYAEKDGLKDAASRKGVMGFMARRALNTSRMAQGASFDGRQVGGIGKNLGIGEGRTGGWKKSVEEVKEKEKKYAESLGTVDDKDPRVMMLKQIEEKKHHDLEHEQDELKRLKENLKKAKNGKKPDGTKATPEDVKAAAEAVTLQEEAVEKAKKAATAAKENIDQEKNRRVLGAVVTDEQLTELAGRDAGFARQKADLKFKKDEMKLEVRNAARATDKTVRDAALAKVAALQEEIKSLDKAFEKTVTAQFRGNDVGYAGILDSYAESKVFSWGMGRSLSVNEAAAKAVRDTKKKAKKEEKKKKDDHGKGHDDHGGDDHGGGGDHGGHGGGGGHH